MTNIYIFVFQCLLFNILVGILIMSNYFILSIQICTLHWSLAVLQSSANLNDTTYAKLTSSEVTGYSSDIFVPEEIPRHGLQVLTNVRAVLPGKLDQP
jgi:hypothetical protein